MAGKLDGKRIAILATDGVEQVELVQPRDAVTAEGAQVEIISLATGKLQAMNHDLEPADTFPVDRTAEQASADDYDALLMPGGTVNADKLRVDPDVQRFVRDICECADNWRVGNIIDDASRAVLDRAVVRLLGA